MVKKIIKNFSYTVISNLISLIISSVVLLWVPNELSKSDYGYWQLYILYAGYVGYLSLGWTDGIYLRYGGVEYKHIRRDLFSSQFLLVFTYSILLAGIFTFFNICNNTIFQIEKTIFFYLIISIIIVIPNSMLLFTLQGSNRLRDYAVGITVERIIYFIIILIFLIYNKVSYQTLISADLIGKLSSFLLVIFLCRDIVFNKPVKFKIAIKEAFYNINTGVKILLANLSAVLSNGIVRLFVEKRWNIEVFGMVSLSFSVINLFMIFVNSIAIVGFPILRKVSIEKIRILFPNIKQVCTVILLFCMMFFWPLKNVMQWVLPKYTDSIEQLVFLLPMCIFECKFSILISVFLKTIRREKHLLYANIVSLIVSVVFGYVSVNIFSSVDLTIFCLLIASMAKYYLADILLSRDLNLKINFDFFEFGIIVFFVYSNFYHNIKIISYLILVIIYIYLKRNNIRNSIIFIRRNGN